MEVRDDGAIYRASSQMVESTELLLDWDRFYLGSLGRWLSGSTPAMSHAAYWIGGTIPWVSPKDMKSLRLDDAVDHITQRAIKDGAKLLPVGSVLIVVRGMILAHSVPVALTEKPLSFNQDIKALVPNEGVHGEFLLYWIHASKERLRSLVTESTHGTKRLPAEMLFREAVFLPSPLEQQAIAEALSDADALIESLSLLLAKKHQIKRGAMQELLTGEKRLPGFEAEWVTRRLDQLADIRSGGTPSTTQDQFWNGDVLWCTPTDITALDGHKYLIDTARKLTLLGVHASATELLPAHSIIMTSRATIGECAINVLPVTTNQGFKNFVPLEGVDTDFLYYVLLMQRAAFINLCSGSTFLEIGKTQLSPYQVTVPAGKGEQTAIAQVLSELDEEIVALQGKLAKARDLKQGMMQALLTGRIRLAQPASKVIPLLGKPATNLPAAQPAHNWQINEAVVIGVLVQRFGNEKFPLPRKRRVKLTYLLHRHAEGRAEGYLKKAAGPYDPNTKYKGPEQIALKNGYVRALRNDKYEGFVAGDRIEQAQRYFEQWYGAATLEWLERFHYRKTDDLELLATVDMAMVDLAANGKSADMASVKRVIAAHPEWRPKLSRELFSDERIAAAIAECAALFPA